MATAQLRVFPHPDEDHEDSPKPLHHDKAERAVPASGPSVSRQLRMAARL